MILDGKYINEEQITKIEHNVSYTNEEIKTLQKIDRTYEDKDVTIEFVYNTLAKKQPKEEKEYI